MAPLSSFPFQLRVTLLSVTLVTTGVEGGPGRTPGSGDGGERLDPSSVGRHMEIWGGFGPVPRWPQHGDVPLTHLAPPRSRPSVSRLPSWWPRTRSARSPSPARGRAPAPSP